MNNSIYAEFLERLQNYKYKYKIDLNKKILILGKTQYIKNDIFDITKDFIHIDGIDSNTSQKKCNEICFEIIENLYQKYKYSIPSEKSEKRRDHAYFKALKPDEMTDEQLISGTDREYARAALEAFILCASLERYLTWDDEQMGNHWFYQGKDKDLIILKKWIKQ